MNTAKLALTLNEAAEITPWSARWLREQIKAGNLKAKVGPKGAYTIRPADLAKFIDDLPDA